MNDPDQLATDETRAAEEASAGVEHRADRPPTPEEERLADSNPLDPAVVEHAEEMNRIGAEVEGEGQIEP